MRTYILEEFEKYYNVNDRQKRTLDRLFKRIKDRNLSKNTYEAHIILLENLIANRASNKERILYILKNITFITECKIVCYNIIGNYDDLVVTITDKDKEDF